MKLRKVTHLGQIVLMLSQMASISPWQPVHAGESIEDYLDMPLEALLSLEVTSVSKKKQRLSEVAAAVFVITQEDIRRSGVTSIPEALRMAPGIQVARLDANKWAITSRGFDTQFANKLLVMIDGRTVYTSSFSGVYWDAQDTLLEDVDRIEVIRGPGATLWGANAVNGVINIITRQADQTHGGLLVAAAGDEEKGIASLRYGAEIGADTDARVYLKYNDRDSSYATTLNDDANDDWQSLRGGFRVDGRNRQTDNWTVQGDIYDSDENQSINLWKDPANPANAVYAPYYLAAGTPDTVDSSGWNLLGKWDHLFSEKSNATLQLYYDHTERSEVFIGQQHDTFDIDLQHHIRAFGNNEIIWGLGYRRIEDDFDNTFQVAFLPDTRTLNLSSAFIQDEIELLPQTLRLTVGSKYEHNDFTGTEIQPSIRLVWLPNARNTLWGSISRAMRTPSRVEYGSQVVAAIVPDFSTTPPTFNPIYSIGNDAFESERLLAYEAGYRLQAMENLSVDLALFYNDYDNLQNFEHTTVSPLPTNVYFDNKLSAHSYGMELVIDWRPTEWWRLQTNYSFIDISSTLDNDSTDTDGINKVSEGSSPKHQLSVRSMMDLGNKVNLDIWAYYVDDLEKTSFSVNVPVPAYTSVNIRVAWRPLAKLELSLTGQNLLDDHHLEFVGENLLTRTEVERSVYGQIRWDF
jgi:iron complex outermembrane receptor protein